MDTPIDLSYPINTTNEKKALDAITTKLRQAKNASIFVDFLVHHHAKKETQELVESLRLPIYAAHMAKSIIDEDHPRFIGLYNGSVSFPGIADAIRQCDVVLALGWWPADTNSGGFSREVAPEKRIDVMDTYVIVRMPTWSVNTEAETDTLQIDGERIEGVYMAGLLSKLAEVFKNEDIANVSIPHIPPSPVFKETPEEKITQVYIWPRIAEFLRPGDVLLSDTGTAGLGLPDAVFPKDIT